MGDILFLAHRIPFPPNRGDKIRSHHVLRALAQIAPVHVGCLADDAQDLAEAAALADIAASYCLVERRKKLIWAGLEAVAKGLPVSLAAFHDRKLERWVSETLRRYPISTIYAFSAQMGQYIPPDFAGRVVFDFVDVDSAKFEAYAQAGKWPRRWIDQREARLLGAEEARIARRADTSLLISGEEAALFRARLDPVDRAICEVRVLRNGIDSTLFDRGLVRPHRAMLDCTGPRMIFTGQMDYSPNIAAVQRVVQRILPDLRQVFPEATFHVVGRNPPREILDLDGAGGCHVWGAVDDIREWLAAADLALVPLEIARGVQNKVLEAMAMALPVVLTPAAATGIGGIDARHYEVAESDCELIGRVIGLLSNHDQGWAMGKEARRLVVEQLSWSACLSPLTAMLAPRPAAVRNAA